MNRAGEMLSTDFLPQNMSVDLHSTSKLRMWYVRTKTFIYYRQIIDFPSFMNCISFINFKSVWSSTLYATEDTNLFILWSLNPDQYSVIHYLICKMTWGTLFGFQSLISPFTALGSHKWLIKEPALSIVFALCQAWKNTNTHTYTCLVFIIMLWCERRKESEVAQSYPTLCNPMEPTRLLRPWDSPGKNTGVGCHCLLLGIFPNQGSNLGLLLWRQTL